VEVVVTVNVVDAPAGAMVAVAGDRPQVAGLMAPLGPVTAHVKFTDPVKLPICARVMTEVFPVVAPAAKESVAGLGVAVKPLAVTFWVDEAGFATVKLESPE
jgi:hypothetical protein